MTLETREIVQYLVNAYISVSLWFTVFGSLSVIHLVKFHKEYLFLAVPSGKPHIFAISNSYLPVSNIKKPAKNSGFFDFGPIR